MNACFETLKGTALRSTKNISREQYLYFRTFMTKTLVYKCKLCQVLLAVCLRETFHGVGIPIYVPWKVLRTLSLWKYLSECHYIAVSLFSRATALEYDHCKDKSILIRVFLILFESNRTLRKFILEQLNAAKRSKLNFNKFSTTRF